MPQLEQLLLTSPVAIRYRNLYLSLLDDLRGLMPADPETSRSLLLDLAVVKEFMVDMIMRAFFSSEADVKNNLEVLEGLIVSQQEWAAQGHRPRHGPLFAHVARGALERAEARFNSGNQQASLLAIAICARHGLQMPDWAADVYDEAYRKVAEYRLSSWDEAFGRPLPKGKSAPAARKASMLGDEVVLWVEGQIANGRSFNTALYEEAGEKFGMGHRQAEELYYRRRQQLFEEFAIPPFPKR